MYINYNIGGPYFQVLMNLTNDNPVGCCQIAACGGLETMCSLIAGHFPSYSSSSSPPILIKENSSSTDLDRQNDRHLTDQELDFLVAILGLLVNLVEKDGHNRFILLLIYFAACIFILLWEMLVTRCFND